MQGGAEVRAKSSQRWRACETQQTMTCVMQLRSGSEHAGLEHGELHLEEQQVVVAGEAGHALRLHDLDVKVKPARTHNSAHCFSLDLRCAELPPRATRVECIQAATYLVYLRQIYIYPLYTSHALRSKLASLFCCHQTERVPRALARLVIRKQVRTRW